MWRRKLCFRIFFTLYVINMLSKHSVARHSALAYLYKPKCEETKFRTGVKFEGHRLKTERFPVHQRATAQIPTSHHPVSHSSVTQFPRGFKLSVKVWLRLLPWVRGFLPYEYPSPSAEREASFLLGETTFWRGRAEVKILGRRQWRRC